MTILTAIRDRVSSSGSAESARGASTETTGDGDALPFARYDHLDAERLKAGLSDHSQIELEAAESYERSHKSREAVLNKLRYLRGSEPFPGYDALSEEEILAALKEADMETVKKVRGYERKFANRSQVMEEVVPRSPSASGNGICERPARLPAGERPTAAPSYHPMSDHPMSPGSGADLGQRPE